MSRACRLLFPAGLIFTQILLFASTAFAAEGGNPIENVGRAIAAALAIGIAAAGGAVGQGKAAAGALEGIARNPAAQPKIFNARILALALIESLVIYALIIAFIVQP